MKIQMKRIIASMLVVTMVLSNGNLTALAGETGSKSESVVEGQSNLDNALPSTSGETGSNRYSCCALSAHAAPVRRGR